jgi:hypothetical protein
MDGYTLYFIRAGRFFALYRNLAGMHVTDAFLVGCVLLCIGLLSR